MEKEQIYNTINNLKLKEFKEIQKRKDKVDESYDSYDVIKEVERIVNPNNQHKMTTIQEFCNHNPHISYELVLSRLAYMKHILIGQEVVCMSSEVDYYLKPRKFGHKGYDYEVYLVMSRELEDELQYWVDYYVKTKMELGQMTILPEIFYTELEKYSSKI